MEYSYTFSYGPLHLCSRSRTCSARKRTSKFNRNELRFEVLFECVHLLNHFGFLQIHEFNCYKLKEIPLITSCDLESSTF